jgi:hypothetical protein
MATKFIELDRRFRDLSTAELEDPEFLASLNDREWGSPITWPELLKHSRVLVLAEAGSGKTAEMQRRAEVLSSEGRYAFFMALESLDREELGGLLSREDEERLKQWQALASEPGWFFLDAVDELKLTSGKLDRALQRFARSIAGSLDRARIVISCRPNDWRADVDMSTLLTRLPLPKTSDPEPAGDEFFLEALRRVGSQGQKSDDATSDPVANAVRTVILLPMSANQIETFAAQSGLKDADAFLEEIRNQNAWTFARRPLDLTELTATWKSSGNLGTRRQQHEANIAAKLRDDPDRPDHGVLSDRQARDGAERLALALALTKTRVLRSPTQALDPERAQGVLDPAEILGDWTEQQRQALMRRALFDPATYGRVRFHHRSVQEYLAACRLRALRDKGMSTSSLFRLLFAERYGVKVVIPSLRAIACWTAIDDTAARRELTRREPEALLSLGDPQSLDLSARADLIRAFVAAYSEGGWRGIDIPVDEIRRLAHPELALTIRELWADGPQNPDVQEFLIELIWQGAISSCGDLAEIAAFDASWSDYPRITAFRALDKIGRVEACQRAATSILETPGLWPERLVRGLIADLFPDYLSVDQLIALLERTPEPKSVTSGASWSLRSAIKAMDVCSPTGVELRNKLTALIWRGRNAKQEFYNITGRFDHLAPPLVALTTRQLEGGASVSSELTRSAVVGARFGGEDFLSEKEGASLRLHFANDVARRQVAFWAELDFMDELVPTTDAWNRAYHAMHDGLVHRLSPDDKIWLLDTLKDPDQSNRHPVALQALMDIWVWEGRHVDELATFTELVTGRDELLQIIAKRSAPPDDRAMRNMRRNQRRRERQAAEREQTRLANWLAWRGRLMTNPEAQFLPELEGQTRANIYSWLNARAGNSHYNVWNRAALESAFSPEIAQLAASSFERLWRETPVEVWSRREDRGSTPWVWIYGLCGVASEAETAGWSASLTASEVTNAARFATLELNGLSPFIRDVAQAHPAAIEKEFGEELEAQLAEGGAISHLPMLEDIARSDDDFKRLFVNRVSRIIRAVPSPVPSDAAGSWSRHIELLLQLALLTTSDADRASLADLAAERFGDQLSQPTADAWLSALFKLDATRATGILSDALASLEGAERRKRAEAFFGRIFGSRDSDLLHSMENDARARALGELVRLVYHLIRSEEDQTHEGAYSPDLRDYAQHARNYLLSALLETPGPVARETILDLANEDDFKNFPDRLRLLARKRAAEDAEPQAIAPRDFVEVDQKFERAPASRDELFQVSLDRLEDLAHDLRDHDFTDRRTVRTIQDETEMQRTLSLRLHGASRGAYIVSREEEVADLKRTDIRLSAVRGDQKAVAEVKIADGRWTLRQLEAALRGQLVGQYLRHENSRAGILLLTYDGAKKYWQHPVTKKRLSFEQVVSYLGEVALAIETERTHSLRLAVFGLDLTDPPLQSTALE